MRPELIWVTGPNGIGKTTLLKLLAGLIRADSGDIDWHYDGQPSRAAPLVSYLPHEGYAKAGLTLKEDFIFWAKINRTQNFRKPNGCDRILEQVGLTPHQSTLTQKLSTGQKRRLSLAKLLAAQKPIWILDEPLTGLDKEARHFVAEILQTHIQNGGIALIASHNPVKIDNIATRRLHLSVP